MYVCDACGAVARPTYFGSSNSEEERPPYHWYEVDTNNLTGIWHVCSEICWERFLNEHGKTGWIRVQR